MRNIVLTILILITLPLIFWGCAEEVTSSDGGYTYEFSVGDIDFTIHTGSGQNQTAYSNTTYRYWINVKECDSRCDERTGISFGLDEGYQEHSWRASYYTGDKLKITMHFDGIETINTIKLGKVAVGNTDVDVYIKNIEMYKGTYGDDVPDTLTQDTTSADYSIMVAEVDMH